MNVQLFSGRAAVAVVVHPAAEDVSRVARERAVGQGRGEIVVASRRRRRPMFVKDAMGS